MIGFAWKVLFAEPASDMGLPFRVKDWGQIFWKEHRQPFLAARRALADLPVHHRARLDAMRLALAFAAAWEADRRNR